MKCATVSCDEFAAVRVFWPGQTRDMCPACALRAQGVAQAMGFALSVAIIAPQPDELAAAAAEIRESGGSIPAEAFADVPETGGIVGLPAAQSPVLNKSGGSDVEGK